MNLQCCFIRRAIAALIIRRFTSHDLESYRKQTLMLAKGGTIL